MVFLLWDHMRLGPQDGADTLILNDSNYLYRQGLPVKDFYLAHTRGILAPSNSELSFYYSSSLLFFTDLLVEGPHGSDTVLGVRGQRWTQQSRCPYGAWILMGKTDNKPTS